MLTLERLKLVNFLSHRDTDLVFSSYEGLILIEGKTEDGHYTSNGAGKSTILEGVYYALTGKTFRGVSADSVVNNKVGKDMEVTLDFSLGKTPFKISRYRKHTLKGNSLEFYEGDQDRSSRLQADTQKVIDDTVNIDPNILSGVLLLGEGLSSRFTYLSDTDKKSLLESTIMTSHDILAIRDQLGVKMRDLQEQVKFLEGQIYSNTQSITESQHLLSLDKPTMEREVAEISCKIDEYTQGLSSLGEVREGLQSKKLILSQAISQVTSTQESLRRSQSEESTLITQLSTVQAPDPTCPMCHQKLPNEEGIELERV